MSESHERWYFAYGSNMDPAQMEERKVHYRAAEKALLRDYRLAFNLLSKERWNGGVSDVVASPGSTVEGVLYLTTEAGLKTLDRYEGVHKDRYRRGEVTVEHQDGRPQQATCYEVVTKSPQFIPPSRAYLATLIRGAEAHHLNPSYIEKLRAIPVADAELDSTPPAQG